MRSVLLVAATLIYLASTGFVVLGLVIVGDSGCDEGCSVGDRTHWWQRGGSWQWDAMMWLGFAAGFAGLVFVALALFAARRPLIPWFALAAFAVLLGAALTFYWPSQSDAESEAQVAFFVTVGSGIALAYLSVSRQRAGTRLE
jgi:hypothetical protein